MPTTQPTVRLSTIFQMVKADNPILTQPALQVTTFAPMIRKCFDLMWDVLEAHDGQGLAAPQIGIPARMLIARYKGNRIELVNPVVVKAKPPVTQEVEGCLSLPGVHAWVPRASRVLVRGQDATGKPITVSAVGQLARCLQHELDHLDGILITQRGMVLPKREAQDDGNEQTQATEVRHAEGAPGQ